MEHLVERTIGHEFGEGLWDERENVYYHGMDLALRSDTRDQFTVWSVHLNAEAGEVQERFSKNPQFKKDLLFFDNTPEGLYQFMTSEKWIPTAVCAGGVSTYVLSQWPSESKAWLEEYQSNPRSAKINLTPELRSSLK